MKNIMILGSPRAGKSTFAKMILKEFPNYNIIQEDILISAYKRAIYESTMENNKDDYVTIKCDLNIVYKMLRTMFDYSIEYEPSLNFILDGMSISLEEASKYMDKDTIVLVFGYPNITVEEGFENVRKYDTINDWTYTQSRYMIESIFETYIKVSKRQKEECEKLGIKFVDTSKNRKQVLKDLFEWIKKEL